MRAPHWWIVAAIVFAGAAPKPAGAADDRSSWTGEFVPLEPVGIELPYRPDDGGRAWKRAGYAVYVVGALFDLYTTKRALDAGLNESNPLMNGSRDPDRTLVRGSAVKIGFALLIARATKRHGGRATGAWLMSYGIVQLGAGMHNLNATRAARADALLPPATTVAEAAAGP